MIELELIKGGITLAVSMLTILAALLIARLFGNALTVKWNIRQKRRELQLSAAHQFYDLYGEFFAVWKLWSYSRGASNVKGIVHDEDQLTPVQMRWALYQRVCKADGQVEALLVKVASERVFKTYAKEDSEIETLCKFREAYKTLHLVIRKDEFLDWPHPSDPPYQAFKCVAANVAYLLNSGDVKRKGLTGKLHYQPEEKEAREALRLITSHDWCHSWKVLNDKSSTPADQDRTKADTEKWCGDTN